jgi:putative Mg2+ transporter-C (MgtC) family protein
MTSIYIQMALGLAGAWVGGGLIGAERTYHGRAAGFRTHALVAIAAAATMLVSFAPSFAPGASFLSVDRLDPTHLAQGVMTGVGFLGAGVIFKEGVNVQGLTTAASVWATAAIGLLFGAGEYAAGALAVVGVLVTLLVMRWVEDAAPSRVYAWSVFRFRSVAAPDTAGLHALLEAHGLSMRDVSYALSHDGAIMEFSGNLVARRSGSLADLAAHLRTLESVAEFELARISK